MWDYVIGHVPVWASTAFTWLFGVVVPWWAWAGVGLAGGMAVYLLLPALTPDKLRSFLAMLVVSAGAIISAGSWGIDFGVHQERDVWVLRNNDAKATIINRLGAVKDLEDLNGKAATAATLNLQAAVNALLQEQPKDTSGPSCLDPQSVLDDRFVDGLSDLRPRRLPATRPHR